MLSPGFDTSPGLLNPLTPAVLFTASNTKVTFPTSVSVVVKSMSVALPLHSEATLLVTTIVGSGATLTVTVVVGTASGQPSLVVTWKSYSTPIVVLVVLLNVATSVINKLLGAVTGKAAYEPPTTPLYRTSTSAKVLLAVLLVTLNVNPSWLHTSVGALTTVRLGFGFTVTTISKSAPIQNVEPGPAGVTVYVTLIGLSVVLTGASVKFPVPPLPLSPTQINVEDGTFVIGAIDNVSPEQAKYVPAGTAVPMGIGSTVTITGKIVPSQPFALGTIKYSTVPPAALARV